MVHLGKNHTSERGEFFKQETRMNRCYVALLVTGTDLSLLICNRNQRGQTISEFSIGGDKEARPDKDNVEYF